MQLGHLKEASHYFRQALKLNNEYLTAFRNLHSVCNLLVERWHFRMLNDFNRNEAYREAILKKVKQGFGSVLDIGTGTGILSIFAVNAGANEIYACDYSSTMCDIAKQVLDANEMSDRVTVINKISNDLVIPEDIPQRVSLVVTETMDAGLLGEHLLQTLQHAWSSLLLPPYPNINTIYTETNHSSAQKYGIVIPFGASLWAAPIECSYIARKYFNVIDHYGKINFSNISLRTELDEPYDTENLVNLEFKMLTEPIRVKKIDFNNPAEIADFYSGKYDDEKVKFKCSGKLIDAVAVWFDVHLDEDITLSSSPIHPEAETCCWDQVVFPLKVTDDNLEVKFKCKDGKLSMEFCANSAESLANLLETSLGDCGSVHAVSSDMILFLNNETLCENLSCIVIEKSIVVLDLSPFPLLGFNLIKLNNSYVVSVLKSESDICAVKEVARRNGLDMSKLECITEDCLEDLLDDKRQFDLIINNFIDSTGELKEKNICMIPTLRKMLKQNGTMLPQNLSLCCRVIQSDWLTKTSRVVNKDLVDKYKVASFINTYQVPQHIDVDMNTLEHSPLSEPVECFSLNLDTLSDTTTVSRDISVSVQSDGCINAIPYWFQYKMVGELIISSACKDSNVNQAVMLVEHVNVKAGDIVVLRVNYQNGIIKFQIVPSDK